MNQEPTDPVTVCADKECEEWIYSPLFETSELKEPESEESESEVDLEREHTRLSKIIYYDNSKITKSYDIENFLYAFCLALVFVYVSNCQ